MDKENVVRRTVTVTARKLLLFEAMSVGTSDEDEARAVKHAFLCHLDDEGMVQKCRGGYCQRRPVPMAEEVYYEQARMLSEHFTVQLCGGYLAPGGRA